MSNRTVGKRLPVWRVITETISWLLLGGGLICIAKTVSSALATKQFTSDTLSWLAVAFLVLLLGSLLCHVGADKVR